MIKRFNNIVIFCIFLWVNIYVSFYFFFFVILGNLSIDGVIALSSIFLFICLYRAIYLLIYNYLLTISKNIWIFFFTLISVCHSLKNLVLILNENYLFFFKFKFIIIITSVNNFTELMKLLTFKLFNNFLINFFTFQLFLKLNYLNNLILKNNKIYFFNFWFLKSYFMFNLINLNFFL